MSPPADLIVAGGLVYTPAGPLEVDVHIKGGRIHALRAWGQDHGAVETVDAGGLLVLPGAIDAHVHGRDPGAPAKENFGSLTAAAAAGGVTTVLEMPNTTPAVDSARRLEEKLVAGGRRFWLVGTAPHVLDRGRRPIVGASWRRGRQGISGLRLQEEHRPGPVHRGHG
ncbi:MAG: amidohydrolase family protein [Chloroflexota bacterium]